MERGATEELAQTSGQAAEEIRNLLDRSEKQVGHLVGSTKSRVSEGQQTTEKAVKSFGKITSEISDISERVQYIERASQEQSEGVTQTQSAMAQLDDVAAKQATVAEHIISFARELDQVAYEIRLLSNDVLGKRRA